MAYLWKLYKNYTSGLTEEEIDRLEEKETAAEAQGKQRKNIFEELEERYEQVSVYV